MILDPANACLGIVDSLADAQEAAETKAMAMQDARAMAALTGGHVTEISPGIVMVTASEEEERRTKTANQSASSP